MNEDGTIALEDKQEVKAREAMDRMSGRITLNYAQGFAGAFVVCPPEGDIIELLLLNNDSSPVVFWSLLKTKAEMALADIAEKERQGQGWR